MVNTEIRLIIFFAAKDGEALYSQQKQDRELTVAHSMSSIFQNSDYLFIYLFFFVVDFVKARVGCFKRTKFRFKLHNVVKTTRPFRYDLNQIPYVYTVEVTNRFKGLDLIQ